MTLKNLTILATGEDRDEWLKERVGKYTATTVTAIAGSNPYTKLIDVWNSFTDPDYTPDHLRNKWLDERAKLGNDREVEILEWASQEDRTGGPGNPFIPNLALVCSETNPRFAATPDGYKYARDNNLVLIEAKTTQQDWEKDGLPQHIYDQCLWQMHVTGAVSVWVAVERYTWSKGKATLVGTWLTVVLPDAARLAFLLAKVDQFQAWLDAGIAPESDIEISAEPVIEFDDTPEEIESKLAEWEAMRQLDADLAELDEIRERIKDDLARAKVLEGKAKAAAIAYDGRRVHLIGQRMIAKLVRGNRTEIDKGKIPAEILRAATGWVESETVKIEKNPEYTPTTKEG